jgi:hypothetical protein
VAQSYRILAQDKELMVLPLMSGGVIAGLLYGMASGFGLVYDDLQPGDALPVFATSVAAYAIGLFCQAAVVAGATQRMQGADPTLASALAAAARRIGPILVWAFVAATVGIVIRAIQDRVGFIGKIVTGVADASWSLATYFVVPVLVLEERSLTDSFTRSVDVFKRTWGETVTGGMNFGAAALCAWSSLVAAAGLLAWAGASAAVVVSIFLAGSGLLLVFFAALDGIYLASLYHYAVQGQTPPGFERETLQQAFVPKGH